MKKSTKKLFSIFAAVAISVSMIPHSLAADEVKVMIGGSELQIEEGDTKPFVIEGRTLVPMRAVFEALGANVEWNGDTETITAFDEKEGVEMGLSIGSDIMTVNGVSVTLDVPAQIVNDRTVVPIRAIAEGLNKKVEWSGETSTVYIDDKEENSSETEPAAENDLSVTGPFHSSIQHETASPEWVKNLAQAKDENTTQLFVVAGMGMDKTTATVSMHERDENGEWKQILSTPAFVGKNGLCLDSDHAEGCGQTPIGVYRFNKAFGIADDPGCKMDYIKVTDDTYWSGDFREGMRYNEMVDIKDFPDLDMENSEHIVDYEYQYQYCLNISFNEDGTAGRGSAIFLHCLGPVKPYTGGCVALPENIMKMVMQRVDEDCVVVIDTLENMGGSF